MEACQWVRDAAGSFIATASVKSASGFSSCHTGTNTGFSAGCGFYIYNQNVPIETNTLYEITLYAEADASGSGSSYAYADPSISIDSTDNPGYSVLMSPGVVNAVTPRSRFRPPGGCWLRHSVDWEY